MGRHMRAIVHDSYGSDVLELSDVDRPAIADDEVLVRVQAAGVDRGVWHVMTGLPYAIRLAGFGLRAPKTPVLGMDLAGGQGVRGGSDRRMHHDEGGHGSDPSAPTTSSTTRTPTSRRAGSVTT